MGSVGGAPRRRVGGSFLASSGVQPAERSSERFPSLAMNLSRARRPTSRGHRPRIMSPTLSSLVMVPLSKLQVCSDCRMDASLRGQARHPFSWRRQPIRSTPLPSRSVRSSTVPQLPSPSEKTVQHINCGEGPGRNDLLTPMPRADQIPRASWLGPGRSLRLCRPALVDALHEEQADSSLP